jgi:hypothetical protein
MELARAHEVPKVCPPQSHFVNPVTDLPPRVERYAQNGSRQVLAVYQETRMREVIISI